MFRDTQNELIIHHNPKLGTTELNKLEGKYDLIHNIVVLYAVIALLQEQDRKTKFIKKFKKGQPPYEDRFTSQAVLKMEM